MSHDRPEISQWLLRNGHTPREIEGVLTQLDRFDVDVSRASIFDDLAQGDFDLQSEIDQAQTEELPLEIGEMRREEDIFLQGAYVV
jgi:hypothetical protein